jgi:hypothetical protein
MPVVPRRRILRDLNMIGVLKHQGSIFVCDHPASLRGVPDDARDSLVALNSHHSAKDDLMLEKKWSF